MADAVRSEKGGKFGFVIVDESHYLRTRGSQRTELVTPVLQVAGRV